MAQLDPDFATGPELIEAAGQRAQIEIVDLQIKLLEDSLLRIDKMIDACRQLRTEIEKRQGGQ